MIGGLIKPYILTDVNEHREWEITVRERLDLTGKFVEYGLKYVTSTFFHLAHHHAFSQTQLVSTPRGDICARPGRQSKLKIVVKDEQRNIRRTLAFRLFFSKFASFHDYFTQSSAADS
jgi:hypothetical protein